MPQPAPVAATAAPHMAWLRVPENHAAFLDSARLQKPAGRKGPGGAQWGLLGLSLSQLCYLQRTAVAVQEFLALDSERGSKAAAVWPDVIHEAYPDIPVARGDLKGLIVHLAARHLRIQQACQSLGQPLYDFIEGFAGKAMVTLHLLMQGFHGKRLDLEYGPDHTILHFRTWMDALSVSAPQALRWAAPKCSSFVILCRGPSGRAAWNQWWGDQGKPFVRQGNEIMVRCALWLYMSHLLGCKFIVEQPMNSVFYKLPPMSAVLTATQAEAITTWHSAFGADTAKPFTLFSNISQQALAVGLKRKKPRIQGPKRALVKKKGAKFTGNRNLSKSQAYTPQFGAAVAAFWACCRPQRF